MTWLTERIFVMYWWIKIYGQISFLDIKILYQKIVNAYSVLNMHYFVSEFACLRDQIKKEQCVVAFFGGSDPTGESVKLLTAGLDTPLLPFNLIIVHGSSIISKELRDSAALRDEIAIVNNLPNYDAVLATAKYAFGASGSSNWERFCLDVPTSLVSVADNQTMLAAYLQETSIGSLFRGWASFSQRYISTRVTMAH